jgi:hypothetical protein
MSSHNPGEAVRGKTLRVVDLWHNAASTPLVCIVHRLSIVPKKKHIATVRLGKLPSGAERLIDPSIDIVRGNIDEVRREGRNESFKLQTVLDDTLHLLALGDVLTGHQHDGVSGRRLTHTDRLSHPHHAPVFPSLPELPVSRGLRCRKTLSQARDNGVLILFVKEAQHGMPD